MKYRQLQTDDRSKMVRERLSVLERQHFALSLRVNSSPLPGGDPEEDAATYDQLERQIADLHSMLDEIEGGHSE